MSQICSSGDRASKHNSIFFLRRRSNTYKNWLKKERKTEKKTAMTQKRKVMTGREGSSLLETMAATSGMGEFSSSSRMTDGALDIELLVDELLFSKILLLVFGRHDERGWVEMRKEGKIGQKMVVKGGIESDKE